MLILAPGAGPAPNGTDLCYGTLAYQALRPPMSEAFITANEVILYGFLALGSLCQFVWWLYRHEPILESRDFAITSLVFLNTSVAMLAACLWNTRPFVGANGQTTLSCRILTWLFVSIAPLQSGIGLARLTVLLHRARYARVARRMRQVVDIDDNMSVSSATSTRSAAAAALDHWNSFRRAIGVLALSFGFGEQAKRLERGFKESTATDPENTKDVARENRHLDEEALLLSKEALTTWGMLILVSFTYLPIGMCIIILVFTVPPYKGDCISCDVWWETFIFMTLTYISLLLMRFRIARLLQGEPDPDGVIKEMKIGALIVITCVTTWTIIKSVDPNGADFNHQFCAEWIFAFGLFVYWCMNVPYHLFRAYKDRKRRYMRMKGLGVSSAAVGTPGGGGGGGAAGGLGTGGKPGGDSAPATPTSVANARDIAATLRDPAIFRRFEDFAEMNFCTESVKFLKDVWSWKDAYPSKPPTWRKLKARNIGRTYIAQNAVLEINIPSSVRVAVEAQLNRVDFSPTPDLFDAPESEIIKMLKWYLWPRFCREVEFKDGSAIPAGFFGGTTPRNHATSGRMVASPSPVGGGGSGRNTPSQGGQAQSFFGNGGGGPSTPVSVRSSRDDSRS